MLNGGDANERLVATANGPRVRVTRNVGDVELDLGDVEVLDANPLGGEDILRIEDLSGTSLRSVVADLAADGLIDSVVVKGTSAADPLGLNGANGTVNVTGLAVTVQLTQAERRDKVSVTGRGGVDTFDPTGLASGTIGFTFVQ